MNAYQSKRRTDNATIYLFSKCESFIEIYAKSAGLSAGELTNRVGELLLAAGNREVLGVADQVPALRGNSAARNQPVEQVEVARRPYRRAQVKPHWTQQPKNRAKLMKHIREMWRARKAAPKHGRQSLKGYSYEGKHWTQQPQNKARLKAQMKRVYEKTHKGER